MALRRSHRSTPKVAIAGSSGTAVYAATAAHLGWKVVAVAGGDEATSVAASVGASHQFLDDVLDHGHADIVVVGTDPDRRLSDVDRLVRRGVNALVVPGRFDVVESDPTGRAGAIAVADPFAMSPSVQQWFAIASELTDVSHLAGRASSATDDGDSDLVWHAASALLIAARVTATAYDDLLLDQLAAPSEGSAPPEPTWELQAASSDAALRVDMFPTPQVEHNGNAVHVAHVSGHPADVFGTRDVLRTFADDLAADRRPVLGLAHMAEVNDFLDRQD